MIYHCFIFYQGSRHGNGNSKRSKKWSLVETVQETIFGGSFKRNVWICSDWSEERKQQHLAGFVWTDEIFEQAARGDLLRLGTRALGTLERERERERPKERVKSVQQGLESLLPLKKKKKKKTTPDPPEIIEAMSDLQVRQTGQKTFVTYRV